jgi:DNA-binding CsgD family transcriptional regulator
VREESVEHEGGLYSIKKTRLGVSEWAMKAHLASIYNKLGVDSRAAAIAVAAQRGLLK